MLPPQQGQQPAPPMGAMQPQGGQPMGGMPLSPQPPQPPPQPAPPPDPMQDFADEHENDGDKELQSKNIAEDLEEDELLKIAAECKRGFDDDESSRKDWLMDTADYIKMARQTKEMRTYPWPGASSIKYPLISTAAMQFSARAYPSLIPADGNIVQAQVWGFDKDGSKNQLADRIGKYMSWQLMEDLDYWEEDMDRLLMMLSVVGLIHKKTYYCSVTEKIQSKIIYPENFVIDYWTRNLDDAPRTSEIIFMSAHEIKEKQLNKEFLDVDLGDPPTTEPNPINRENKVTKSTTDWTTPYKIIEQHTWYDIGDKKFRQPYIITFDYNSGKILRISARWRKDGIKMDGKKIISYCPERYYTKFGFIPNPDGSYYDLGFGHLLGSLNEGVNSLVNQLIDAGTLSNLQVGFIGKGLRMKMGTSMFQPGEWKAVNATGDDLRKQIVPLPTKEPSNVLFELLGMLITSGKELASVAEIFTGKMPGQNTPATTTMATIEQGMKVFTAIYKRVYRSLAKEYKKLFDLNGYYLDKESYASVLDQPVNPQDFDPTVFDVCPTADPTATSQTEKLLKAQALVETLQQFGPGSIDAMEVLQRILQAQEQPNWEKLIPGMAQTGTPQPKPPPPDPKVMAIQEKAKAEQARVMMQGQALQQKAQLDSQSQQQELQFKSQEHQMDLQMKQAELALKGQEAHADMNIKMAQAQTDIAASRAMNAQDVAANKASHEQSLKQGEESHSQKMAQQKEAAKLQKKTTSTGSKISSRGKSSS